MDIKVLFYKNLFYLYNREELKIMYINKTTVEIVRIFVRIACFGLYCSNHNIMLEYLLLIICHFSHNQKCLLIDIKILFSSSYYTASNDLPNPLSPPVYIVHHSWEVFKAISCISTELLYIGSSWLSCLCSSMLRGPEEYIAYEFVLTSLAVSCMSGSSNFDSFRDEW